jgi:hypothetical protein
MTENTENGDATKPSGPIEVWIRQGKLATFTCMVVYNDESTYEFDLASRTLAAAQQEATGRLMPGHSCLGNLDAARLYPDVVNSTLRESGVGSHCR